MCIVRSFHEFHDNVIIRATYMHILPNEKYRKYRVIIVSKPKILCNIVWALKKISFRGGLDLDVLRSNIGNRDPVFPRNSI